MDEMDDMRADFAGLTSELAAMRSELEGPLVASADRAGRAIEAGLLRAVRAGRFGFEDLGRVAMSVLSQIAAAAVRGGIGAAVGGAGGSGGLLGVGTSLVTAALGLPGRATGGPVAPGRAYLVGERGPELFLPTSSGRVMTGDGADAAQGRNVQIAITINGQGASAPQALARSARQVARAVRGALGDGG